VGKKFFLLVVFPEKLNFNVFWTSRKNDHTTTTTTTRNANSLPHTPPSFSRAAKLFYSIKILF
jgi:hypothetical protein